MTYGIVTGAQAVSECRTSDINLGDDGFPKWDSMEEILDEADAEHMLGRSKSLVDEDKGDVQANVTKLFEALLLTEEWTVMNDFLAHHEEWNPTKVEDLLITHTNPARVKDYMLAVPRYHRQKMVQGLIEMVTKAGTPEMLDEVLFYEEMRATNKYPYPRRFKLTPEEDTRLRTVYKLIGGKR